jgi:uncharacterized protein YwqG
MIKLTTQPTDSPLTCQSKWWGQPDMPEELDYPHVTVTDEDGESYEDPLTFICQLRCEELAPFDVEGLLPHVGMLYFFAALDYFLGDLETPAYPGMGQWQPRFFRVLYAPDCSQLHTHRTLYPDGTPANLPAEAITFSATSTPGEGIRLLGRPYLEEVCEQMPDMISLLQIDEDDRWQLTFHDSGMLNFLISPEHLLAHQWQQSVCYLHSF